MALLNNTQVTGKVSADTPASAPEDYIRLQEFQEVVSGLAPKVHTHVTADITDLRQKLGLVLADVLNETDSIYFITLPDGTLSGVAVRLKTGGGIKVSAAGLEVDWSGVSRVGHKHVLADILDFDAQLPGKLAGLLFDTPSVEWSGVLGANVRVKAGGGLKIGAQGLEADFGSGVNQVARGNHTHDLLHAPVTLGPSTTLQLTLNGQQLSGEVRLADDGGLLVETSPESGLAVDFGPAHTQVARGDHTHALPGIPLSGVQDTTSIDLGLDGGILSGVVRTDPAPSSGRGKVGIGPNGLYIELGTNADQAAAGNHVHNAATEDTAGFLSAQDKLKLDRLVAGEDLGEALRTTTLRVVLEGDGVNINSGVQEYAVMPYSGVITGWDLSSPQTGVLWVDVRRKAYPTAPLAGDSMVGTVPGEMPNLGGGRLNRNLNLSGWVSGGGFQQEDVLAIAVSGVATVKRACLQLRIVRT